jgi:hypothetical protein
LHKTEHVLGAMIDLVHQKENLVFVGFPIGHIGSTLERGRITIKTLVERHL